MLMIRGIMAGLVLSIGVVNAMQMRHNACYDQPVQLVVVDLKPVAQEFADVIAGVFVGLDDIQGVLVDKKNTDELRALRCFIRVCLKAKKEKNVCSMLEVLDGFRGFYQRLMPLSVEVESSLSEVIGELESLATPEACVWRQELSKITEDMHEFVDALALVAPLCMTLELQKLTEKITELLTVGTLETFAECVAALRRLPTLLNRNMQTETKETVSSLLQRLLSVSLVLDPFEEVHCMCGGCE